MNQKQLNHQKKRPYNKSFQFQPVYFLCPYIILQRKNIPDNAKPKSLK